MRYSCYEYRAVDLMKETFSGVEILSWQDVPW
jgi:hypothetical protein